MILELKRQGLSVSAIARQTGLDRKTVKKYLKPGLEAPIYGPRPEVQALLWPELKNDEFRSLRRASHHIVPAAQGAARGGVTRDLLTWC